MFPRPGPWQKSLKDTYSEKAGDVIGPFKLREQTRLIEEAMRNAKEALKALGVEIQQ